MPPDTTRASRHPAPSGPNTDSAHSSPTSPEDRVDPSNTSYLESLDLIGYVTHYVIVYVQPARQMNLYVAELVNKPSGLQVQPVRL